MFQKMIESRNKEPLQQMRNSNTPVYQRSEEAEAAILPGQPWFFRDYTEQPVQMKTDNNVIQMATEEQRGALTAAIAAYEEPRNTLQQAAAVEPDTVSENPMVNPKSHSLVYEWGIGVDHGNKHTLRGHVHYRGFQNVKQGPVPGNAWIENVNAFHFPLPKHVLNKASTQDEANILFGEVQPAAPPPPAFAFRTRSQQSAPTK